MSEEHLSSQRGSVAAAPCEQLPPAHGPESLLGAARELLGAGLLQRKLSRRLLQRRAAAAETSADVHLHAERGLSGPATRLPHGEALQAAFGRHDLSQVQAHVGGAAATACDSIGAQAYATGSSIAFREEPDLHTAAHEAAHVVQQRAGVSLKGGLGEVGDAYEQHADAVADRVVQGRSAEDLLGGGPSHAGPAPVQRLAQPGTDPDAQQAEEEDDDLAEEQDLEEAGGAAIQAKLTGTRQALVATGGEATKRGRRTGGSWHKVLSALGEYELLESYIAARTFNDHDGRRLLRLLKRLEMLVQRWLSRHSDVAGSRPMAGEDPDKRTRAGMLKMLLPRLGVERADLEARVWASRSGRNDARRTGGADDAVGGQMNRLDKIKYGNEKGFFKEDRWDTTQDHNPGIDVHIGHATEQDSGDYRVIDANFGARAVAMSRLDQLLGGGVIANTEFATHSSTTGRGGGGAITKLGTFQEKAAGRSAADLSSDQAIVSRPAERAAHGDPSALCLSDPELQRQLNILQVIDAIAGQLDRHQGNYFIKVDGQGRVQRVTGIDLDMAFSPEHTPEREDEIKDRTHNYRGIPALFDRAFALRLLALTEQDLRLALGPLLGEGAELGATIARFRAVQAAIQGADQGQLIDSWDWQTAARQINKDDSYLGTMRYNAIWSVISQTSPDAEVVDAIGESAASWDRCFNVNVRDVSGQVPALTPTRTKEIIALLHDALRDDLDQWKVTKVFNKMDQAQQDKERRSYRQANRTWLGDMAKAYVDHLRQHPSQKSPLPAVASQPAVPAHWKKQEG